MTMSDVRSTEGTRSAVALRPPRIPGTPLLGHLMAFRADRAAVQLRTARSHPDVALLRMGVFDLLLVSSPHLAHDILQTQDDAFSKSLGLSLFLRPLLGDGLLTSEREFHARQRRLIAPAFTLKRIAGYADTMADRASRAVASWNDGETFDAAEVMMKLTLEIVGKTLFDAEVGSDADAVGEAVTKVMSNMIASLSSVLPIPPAIPTRRNRDSRRATGQLDAIIYRLIAERRMAPADRGDVLSMLLAAQDEDGTVMTDKQIRDESMTLFLAGHETTANALAWALYLLARNPDVRARAEEEIRAQSHRDGPLQFEHLKHLPFTLAVLKEAMRLYPPAFVIGRRSLRDVVLAGGADGRRFQVKKHTNVLVNVLGIHRRADAFPEPERFDPTRFLGDREKELPRCAYMPFGAGSRVCIGNHFALMEGHLLLATILRSARLDLVPGTPDITTEPLVTLRPKGGVPVRVSKLA
jgi:cytochrome P450